MDYRRDRGDIIKILTTTQMSGIKELIPFVLSVENIVVLS
jgi:hypothetical protein